MDLQPVPLYLQNGRGVFLWKDGPLLKRNQQPGGREVGEGGHARSGEGEEPARKMSGCPVCGSGDHKHYLTFQDRAYRRCGKCFLVYAGGHNHSSEGDVMYTHEYIHNRGHDATDSHLAKAKEATATHYLSHLEKYVSKGALLDVGCSTGISLKVARERGWDIYGTDVNEAAADAARKYLNTDTIKTGALHQEMFPDGIFSAALMLDVIEHVRNPSRLVEVLKEKLKSSGLLLVITPNVDSLSARVLGGKWPHQLAEHVCLYSPRSIRYLLGLHQLKVLKMGWAMKFVNVDMVRRHLECHPHIFLSKAMRGLLTHMSGLKTAVFPLNIGEMYVLAQKP